MLQRVSIQNFKSLKDVTLDLQKVNLLIGPNNSGKTNFLKAITAFGIGSKIDSKYFRNGSTELKFEIKYKFEDDSKFIKDLPSSVLLYKKKFTREITNQNNLVTEIFPHELFFIDKNGLQSEFNNETPFLKEFYQYFQGPIYTPNPLEIIKPTIINDDENVNSDSSNIISFLFNLSQNYQKSYESLQNEFAKCVGDLVRIGIPGIGGSKHKIRLFDNLENGFWSDDVSEGVLYFLAILSIVHQPNPPKLLLLEEPERGIHPRRIGEIMNFIFQLAEEKDVQIILTTHNEHVLDDFATRPEAVFVFDKNEEGATEVRNLKKDIIDPSHQKSREYGLDGVDFTTNLSNNWLYGLLGGVPENI